MKSPENLNSKWNEFAPKPKQIFESNLKSPFSYFDGHEKE